MITIFIVEDCKNNALIGVTSGFGWESIEAARAQLNEISQSALNNSLKLFEVTINAKEIE